MLTYELLPELASQDAMLANVRVRLEELTDVSFTPDEWHRFVLTYPDRGRKAANLTSWEQLKI